MTVLIGQNTALKLSKYEVFPVPYFPLRIRTLFTQWKTEWVNAHDKKSAVTSLGIYRYDFYKEITHLGMTDINLSYCMTIKHLFV